MSEFVTLHPFLYSTVSLSIVNSIEPVNVVTCDGRIIIVRVADVFKLFREY